MNELEGEHCNLVESSSDPRGNNEDRRVDDARLTRIEGKLDDMGRSMLTLIRIEERQTMATVAIEGLVVRLTAFEVRITDIEAKQSRLIYDSQTAIKTRERVLWIVGLVAAASIPFLLDIIYGAG